MEKKDNSGAIFKNTKKTQENHPDLTGNAVINGVEMWVSGWTKVSQKGEKFMSLSFKPKDQTSAPLKPVDDDDLPW
jgi:uncharacterized protein (DUF736 family)